MVAFSGLPGVGKTTVAKSLARSAHAIHLRVDSVEAAINNSTLGIHAAEDAGYLAIASVAKDNLLLGFDVIADTVNPIGTTRKLWADTAEAGGAYLLNIEVICSDRQLHRKRVESRKSDIRGLIVPDWQEVVSREFEPWQSDRIILDTSIISIEEATAVVIEKMGKLNPSGL